MSAPSWLVLHVCVCGGGGGITLPDQPYWLVSYLPDYPSASLFRDPPPPPVGRETNTTNITFSRTMYAVSSNLCYAVYKMPDMYNINIMINP